MKLNLLSKLPALPFSLPEGKKKWLMLAGIAVLATAAISGGMLASKDRYVALFGSEQNLPVSQIVTTLDGEKQPYRIDPDNGQILVPEQALSKVRMLLAGKGIQALTPSGYLGTDATGTQIVNSSNTFDELIPGASITFTEVPEDGKPITLKISQDEGTSQQKVQGFVDAYNSLVDTLSSLTDTGSNGSAGGAFAGDAGINSLNNQLNHLVHGTYNGASLIDYGITLDTHGHLSVDSEKFEQGIEKNPQGLTDIFVGDDSMVGQIDDLMDTYLNASNGIITKRQNAITEQQDEITDEAAQLKETYNTNYERYVNEWTATLVEITQMQQSMSAFM